jgi:predicted AAA+ superfamily ATPase
MIKETVLQHKAEKERFISESKKYILREKIPYAEKFLNENIIKVITGPRRAGKSVFCMLLLKDKEFAYLNFDDENLVKIKNYDELIKVLYEVYPNAKYFFFDEIQNLDKWELFINKLHRRNFQSYNYWFKCKTFRNRNFICFNRKICINQCLSV